jgi:hypothetical protein
VRSLIEEFAAERPHSVLRHGAETFEDPDAAIVSIDMADESASESLA